MKKQKKISNFRISRYYLESWNYLLESKNFVYFTTTIFFLFAILGFILPIFFVDIIKDLMNQLIQKTMNMNTIQLIEFILLNNIKTGLIGLLSGILFGFIPLYLTILNGYVLGFISRYAVQESSYLSLLRLLPHGIFELPAIIISMSVGIKLGMFFFSKNSDKEFMRRLFLSLKVFFLIIIPLLVIAAFIEGIFIGLMK